MRVTLIIFVIGLISGLFCIGGFLWGAMEGKPRKVWLIGAGATILVALAGLLIHKG